MTRPQPAEDIYIVIDIETNGPVPGLFSMLSIGAVATTKDKEVGQFYEKLLPLEEAQEHSATMEWWTHEPGAWEEVTTNQNPAEEVFTRFVSWLEAFEAKIIPVAHPVAFDIGFVLWYLYKFTGRNPFTRTDGPSHGLDLTSYVAGKYNYKLAEAHRSKLPKELFEGAPEHSHNALEDALGYAALLRNVLRA